MLLEKTKLCKENKPYNHIILSVIHSEELNRPLKLSLKRTLCVKRFSGIQWTFIWFNYEFYFVNFGSLSWDLQYFCIESKTILFFILQKVYLHICIILPISGRSERDFNIHKMLYINGTDKNEQEKSGTDTATKWVMSSLKDCNMGNR